MVSFWEAVVRQMTPAAQGGESAEEVRDMRRGTAKLRDLFRYDLRDDKDHPFTRAVAGRAGIVPRGGLPSLHVGLRGQRTG